MRADGKSCQGEGGCGCATCGDANSSVGAQALAWAMQVQSPAARADKFWGPLLIASTATRVMPLSEQIGPVHGAIARASRFVVALSGASPWLASHLPVHAGAGPLQQGDPPVVPVDPDEPKQPGTTAPEVTAPGVPAQPQHVENPSPQNKPPSTPPVVTEAQRDLITRTQRIFDKPGISLSGKKCCPELKYPAKLDSATSGENPVGDLDTGVAQGYRIVRHYDWEVEFLKEGKEGENKDCACECCEFVQLIVRSVWKFTPTVDTPEARALRDEFDSDAENSYENIEDKCEFLVKEGGEWTSTHGQRGYEPPGKKGVDWEGPYCYGDYGRPSEAPPGCPPEVVPAKTRPTACQIKAKDAPGRDVPAGVRFEWEWLSWGVVFDTCLGIVARIKYLWWYVGGEVPWPPGTRVKWHDGPGQDGQAQGEVPWKSK